MIKKLKSLLKRWYFKKAKHVLAENKSIELLKKVEAISRKGLNKDLINGYKILNGTKYFSSGIFQHYLIFISAKNTLNTLVVLLELVRGNLMARQKKILNI